MTTTPVDPTMTDMPQQNGGTTGAGVATGHAVIKLDMSRCNSL
jgi:hypothetical protein